MYGRQFLPLEENREKICNRFTKHKNKSFEQELKAFLYLDALLDLGTMEGAGICEGGRGCLGLLTTAYVSFMSVSDSLYAQRQRNDEGMLG